MERNKKQINIMIMIMVIKLLIMTI